MKIIIIPNMPSMSGRHYNIAKTLVAQGHEVHYMLWDLPYGIKLTKLLRHLVTSLFPRQYKYEKFIMHKVCRLPYFWPVINGWLFKFQIRKLFRKLKADIIFSESYTNETEVPKDLPFIYDLADDYPAPADVYGSPIYKLAFKLLGVRTVMKRQCQNALAVTAVSDILYKFAKEYNSNVIKLPNGVNKEIIKLVKKDKSGYLKNPYSMIYVTGFGPWSRAIETLQTVVKLRKEFPTLELTLVGEGTETNNIKKFIKENHVEDYIHYLGFINDRKTVFSLINKNSIGLHISDKNKWRDAANPIKILEYSALGKKVVSTDLEEVKKMKFPNVFIFSDKNKKNNLFKIMKKALLDKRGYKDFSDTANRVLNEYSWKGLVNKLSKLFVIAKKTINNQKVKRIVHVSPAYPPALGGLEKVVQALARTQSRSGMDVSVITSDQNTARTVEKDNFSILRLRTWTIANTKIMPALFFKLMRFGHNDIIHLHVSSAFIPELVWLLSKLRGFKYIAHFHLDLEPSSPAGFLLKIYKPFVLKYVLRSAGFVVVFTQDQRDSVHKKYGIDLSRIAIVPNGVEEKFYYEKLRKLHKKPRLLFVGRLEEQKNLQQFLRALVGISKKFETIIVGDGRLKLGLVKLVQNLKLKNITFVGRADGKKLLNYYRKSDIFVLPSEREGMPLVLLEAMAMGLPIVATDVTGNRDVVKNNKNGFLVPFGDEKAFQSTLLKISSKKSLYAKLSLTSQKMAKQFSWEKASGKFEKLYEKLTIKSDLKGIKIWNLCLPVLVLANASYLLSNIFGSFVTLGFFLFVPGYLTLSLLKHEIQSRWEIASFSLGLSLLLLMIGGLVLNTTHIIGLKQPLTTINIFIILDLMIVILLAFNKKMKIKLPKIHFSLPKEKTVFTLILTFLPFLAAGGAISLNNSGSNILTMLLFVLIPIIFILLIWRKNLKTLYPYAIFTIALSVLFSTSLRGWFITGHDIQHEFYVFQNTSKNSLWATRTPSSDPYNASLSITILPTIITNITSISASYVYKFVFQVIFAFGLIPLYFFIKKLSDKTVALIGAFIFVSFPPFLNDMPFLNRQEIAFIFFGLLMLTTFIKMSQKPKTILTIVFLIGIMLSHYSTNYATLSILLLSWIFYKLLTRILIIKKPFVLPILSLRVIVLAILLTFLWNSQITRTTSGFEHTLTKTFNGLIHHNLEQSNGVTYALFSTKPKDPNKILAEYAGSKASQVKYSPEQNLQLTKLGKVVSHAVDVGILNKFVRAFSAKVLQILFLLGLVILFIKLRRKTTQQDTYFYALTISFLAILVLITLLPQLSVDYSVTRLFQQALVIIALPIIVATEFLLGFFGRFKVYIVAGFFALLFLHLSGFVPQALGGYPPQLALNNSGIYYDFYYVHKSELVAAKWLNQLDTHMQVAMDRYARMRFPEYPFLKQYAVDPVLSKNVSEYLYQDYTNVHRGIYANYLRGNVIEYSYSSPTADGNLLYSNQDNRIYKK